MLNIFSLFIFPALIAILQIYTVPLAKFNSLALIYNCKTCSDGDSCWKKIALEVYAGIKNWSVDI